jgi:Cu+-exporting ATPase
LDTPALRSTDIGISGMTCANCGARIERALLALPGVSVATVNLATERAHVAFDPARSDGAALVAAIAQAGYRALTTETDIAVGGMSCAACSARIERALLALPGVISASVNLATERAHVQAFAGSMAEGDIAAAIRAAGYSPRPVAGADTPATQDAARAAQLRAHARRAAIAAALALPVVVLAMGPMIVPSLGRLLLAIEPAPGSWNALQWLLASAVAFGPGWRFFSAGASALRHGSPDMNTLVMLGVGSAWAFSTTVLLEPGWFPAAARATYFESVAVVVAVVLLGKYLEALAKGRAGDALRKLAGLQARAALVERLGAQISVPIGQVVVGDIAVVKPGERIPVDGRVVSGSGFVDAAMITGEPMPVAVGPGVGVIGGTINQLGTLRVAVTEVGSHTMLAQIVTMVEQAQGSKLPIQGLADRIVAVFTVVVLAIAALTFGAWLIFAPAPAIGLAVVSAVAVLVVACPCAMGLATPAAIMVGSGRGAELGVLFRRGAALEMLSGVDTVIFDKTGTLTEGKPSLTEIEPADGIDPQALLAWAAAADAGSEHPLAAAIVAGARARKLDLPAVTGFEAIAGNGIGASIAGKRVLVGAERLLLAEHVDVAPLAAATQRLLARGRSLAFVAVDGRAWGVLGVSDTLKPGAAAVVAALRARGLQVALMSGDALAPAQAAAALAGIDDVLAGVLPAGKAEAIRQRQAAGARIAFVGDGINDAPALAQADAGIAVASGTQIAIAAADVTLSRGELGVLVTAIDVANRTMKIIRANLFWAFFYNALLIPVAAGVLYPAWSITMNPMFAGLAMGLSSVFVLANSLRLRRVPAWVPAARPTPPAMPSVSAASDAVANSSVARNAPSVL